MDNPSTHVYCRACTASDGSVRALSTIENRNIKQKLSFVETSLLPTPVTTSIIGESKPSDSRQAQSVVNAMRKDLGRDSEDSTTAFSSPDRLLQVSIPDPELVSVTSAAASLGQFGETFVRPS